MYRIIFPGLRRALLELVLPERCRHCGKAGSEFCDECLRVIDFMGSQVCPVCGGGVRSVHGEGRLCSGCITCPPSWDSGYSFALYTSPLRDLLHRLKYQADTTVLPALARIISSASDSFSIECDTVIPVPLHLHRLRQRGLNQSVQLARLIFPERQERIHPLLLQRVRETQAQTGLTGIERRKNLKGAFVATDPAQIRGRSICLVDDVYTTGATLEECSTVLRLSGAARITVVTLARVEMGRR